MAKKITDTVSAAAPQAMAAMADPPAGEETPGTEPENPDAGTTAPAEPAPPAGDAEQTPPPAPSVDKTPDYAARLLEIYPQYGKLYIDPQGSTYTEDTPAPLRADAALYDNPYHKA